MNKEVNEKKKRYAIVITFLVLMICITGGTYAYFALTASNNSVTGSVGGASLNLTVSKVYPTSEHNNKNMIPQLESTLGDAISDEYNCVDGNGNVVCQVYSATVTNVGSISSELNGTIKFEGISNMPNLKWKRITDSRTIGEYSSNTATTSEALFEEGKVFNANESATYYFVFWIDETGEVQSDSGTFRAIINFNSATGGLTSTITPGEETAATYITSLYDSSRATTVNIGGDTSKPTVSLDSTSGIMLDNNGEYRYYGASPNNYVSFNGELWRIINVANVKSSSTDTTGETRVRIIRADSIGKHSWNYNGSNNWETATLNTTLNGIYYNTTSGDCYLNGSSTTCDYASGTVKGLNSEARGLISDAVWYLGGGSNADLYVDDYYAMERGTTTYTGNPTSTVAKLGIMYPSDYAYAADLSKCTKTGYNYDTDTTNCTGTDWLFNSDYQWLISPISAYSAYAWYVDEAGYVYYRDDGYVEDAWGVRPVAVLSSDVAITGGDGSSENPYTLAQ